MPSRQSQTTRVAEDLVRRLLSHKYGPAILVSLVLVLLVVWVIVGIADKRSAPGGPGAPPQSIPQEGYEFCFWNVENLFDDRDDNRRQEDERYDTQFSQNPSLLDEKLGNLSKVLLAMNDGKGPDILALAEIESERAADLLRERLNRDLGNRADPYTNLRAKEQAIGRHIATAIITRLPVDRGRTQKLDGNRRIMEGHVVVNGHQLVSIASHWTSRLKQRDGDNGEDGREKYANRIYGRFREMYHANPYVDLLVCGDFNDDPDNMSVTEHLHASRNRD